MKASNIANSGREDNVTTPMSLRRQADERLKAWRLKYPEKARKEDAQGLISKAERQEELASGALTFDMDGSISPEQQQKRHDEFIAKAKDYRKQADELLNPDSGTTAKITEPEPNPSNLITDMPQRKETGLAIPSESLTKLRDINTERKPTSIARDGKAQNKITIESTDPRTETWQKHPGSMDVLGVDTPAGVNKATVQPKITYQKGKIKIIETNEPGKVRPIKFNNPKINKSNKSTGIDIGAGVIREHGRQHISLTPRMPRISRKTPRLGFVPQHYSKRGGGLTRRGDI
jgi:hypothetical protein